MQNAYTGGAGIIEEMRERRVLTSLCGPYGNVPKIRPPLVFSMDDVDWFMTALSDTLAELQRIAAAGISGGGRLTGLLAESGRGSP